MYTDEIPDPQLHGPLAERDPETGLWKSIAFPVFISESSLIASGPNASHALNCIRPGNCQQIRTLSMLCMLCMIAMPTAVVARLSLPYARLHIIIVLW